MSKAPKPWTHNK